MRSAARWRSLWVRVVTAHAAALRESPARFRHRSKVRFLRGDTPAILRRSVRAEFDRPGDAAKNPRPKTCRRTSGCHLCERRRVWFRSQEIAREKSEID